MRKYLILMIVLIGLTSSDKVRAFLKLSLGKTNNNPCENEEYAGLLVEETKKKTKEYLTELKEERSRYEGLKNPDLKGLRDTVIGNIIEIRNRSVRLGSLARSTIDPNAVYFKNTFYEKLDLARIKFEKERINYTNTLETALKDNQITNLEIVNIGKAQNNLEKAKIKWFALIAGETLFSTNQLISREEVSVKDERAINGAQERMVKTYLELMKRAYPNDYLNEIWEDMRDRFYRGQGHWGPIVDTIQTLISEKDQERLEKLMKENPYIYGGPV